MVGKVKSYPIDIDTIEAGTIGVANVEDTLDICTVMHLDSSGVWYIQGNLFAGLMKPEMSLGKLMIKDDQTGETYPLKFNQWKKSIKAGEVDMPKKVEFKLNSSKFVQGNYSKDCAECDSSFLAHKRQPICRGCSNKDAHAQIVINKTNVTPASKTKRPRLVAPAKAKEIAMHAYNKGVLKQSTPQEVEAWLETQF